MLSGINNSDEVARTAALEALRCDRTLPEPTEEELLAGTPLREVRRDRHSRRRPPTGGDRDERRSPEGPTRPRVADVDRGLHARGRPVRHRRRQRDLRATAQGHAGRARRRTASPEEGRPPPSPRRPSTGELFERRDEALDESLAALTRKVKRALQDDQNIMLERLRDVKAMITTELEDEHDQRARYADAAIDALSSRRRRPVSSSPRTRRGVTWRSGGECGARGLRGRPGGDDRVGASQADSHRRQWRRSRPRERRLQASGAARASNDSAPTRRVGPSRSASSPPRRVATFDSSSRPNDAPCDVCAHDADVG